MITGTGSSARRKWLPVVVVSLFVTACGVPSTDGPQALPPDIAVIRPAPTDTSVIDATQTVGVAWIRGQRLIVIDRLVAAEARAELVNAALGVLVGGPNTVEREEGLTTLVPPDASLTAQLSGRRAVVELQLGLAPVNQSLAVGQVALTALSVRGVRSVEFTVNGTPTSVPLPGGEESKGPVTARDYKDSVVR